MESIAEQIIKSIEAGMVTGTWQKSWAGGGMAMNAVTGKQYKGGNLLILWALGDDFGSQYYATYKQWESVGAQVRKGSKGIHLVKWVAKVCRDHGSDEQCSKCGSMFPTTFVVFNSAQVDGWEAPQTSTNPDERIADVDAYLSSVGANVRHTEEGSAYYRPSHDDITMPLFESFINAEAYYATLAHEMIHWTGHADRCARDLSKRFGSESYAAEELVAELGAAMLCASLGISEQPRPDHAQYLKHWVGILRDDYRALWTAASLASKAVEFIDNAVVADREEVMA
jgi:antirestriction protein ArdC